MFLYIGQSVKATILQDILQEMDSDKLIVNWCKNSGVFTAGRIGRWPPPFWIFEQFGKCPLPPLWERILREMIMGDLGARSRGRVHFLWVQKKLLSLFIQFCPPPLLKILETPLCQTRIILGYMSTRNLKTAIIKYVQTSVLQGHHSSVLEPACSRWRIPARGAREEGREADGQCLILSAG